MSRPVCIITGIALHDLHQGRWAYGDLHLIAGDQTLSAGGVYIFNACLEDGETAWVYDRMPMGARELVVVDPEGIFERRGVVVVSTLAATLNAAASDYINGGK